MPDVALETRHRVLNNLEGVQSAVHLAQFDTDPNGLSKLQLVLTTLAGCRHSIEHVHDQAQIVEVLRDASDTLGMWQAGWAERVVRSARSAINEMVDDLEAKKPA